MRRSFFLSSNKFELTFKKIKSFDVVRQVKLSLDVGENLIRNT